MTDELNLTFLPDGEVVKVARGTKVLAAVLKAGRPIGYACRGLGVCVSCRVRIIGPTSTPSALERVQLATLDEPSAYRLACLCRLEGDASVRADYW
ncbi:MAG: (2Fe-2S)-binding protein [Myxococcales bacterium]|nr:(2Fe-2S)-binding protein [Myxococcales bacterium]